MMMSFILTNYLEEFLVVTGAAHFFKDVFIIQFTGNDRQGLQVLL
ncbi:MAG: hypothetical protein ACI8Z9_000209, partial [Paraglaciecola sp.]